jgi:anti-sigma B factor antagonist
LDSKFETLILDFKEVDYISSAGLRIIIVVQKKITADGKRLELINMNETVKNVFDITGFSQILNII